MKGRNRVAIVTVVLLSLLLSLGLQVSLADDGQSPPAVARPQPLVKFSGQIASRPEGTKVGPWVIGEQNVQGVEGTILIETKGPAEVGARISVLAKRMPATETMVAYLEAVLITVLGPPAPKPFQITGTVTALDASFLVVEDQRILYDASTEITGRLAVDVFVKIRAIRTADGLKALSIEVLPARDRFVEFEGIIESTGDPTWEIGGREVTVNARTVITGQPEIGLPANVRALVGGSGELVALQIHIRNAEPRRVEWTGVIEQLPPSIAIVPPVYFGRWVVGGRPVMVKRETEIEGTPAIGLSAHVVALEYARRPLVALRIEVVSSSAVVTTTSVP